MVTPMPPISVSASATIRAPALSIVRNHRRLQRRSSKHSPATIFRSPGCSCRRSRRRYQDPLRDEGMRRGRFSPDGRLTILRTLGTGANTRKLLITRSSDSLPKVLVHTDYDNYAAVISPNGKWMAYGSNESHEDEVYVRPFPAVDSARWTVSVSGGAEPMWSHSGRQLSFSYRLCRHDGSPDCRRRPVPGRHSGKDF